MRWLYHAYLQGRPLWIPPPLGVLAGMTVVLFLIAIPRFKYQVDQLPVPAESVRNDLQLASHLNQFHAGSRIASQWHSPMPVTSVRRYLILPLRCKSFGYEPFLLCGNACT